MESINESAEPATGWSLLWPLLLLTGALFGIFLTMAATLCSL